MEDVDTDDEKDPAAAYEEWKGRELMRIKRDRWEEGEEGEVAGARAHASGARNRGGGGQKVGEGRGEPILQLVPGSRLSVCG